MAQSVGEQHCVVVSNLLSNLIGALLSCVKMMLVGAMQTGEIQIKVSYLFKHGIQLLVAFPVAPNPLLC